MKLSTRVRYGLRALVELADIQKDSPVLLDTVAKRQDISRKYLDSIFSGFKAAGLVRSTRGAGGGFVLGKPANAITIADVYRALEGDFRLVDCVQGAAKCAALDYCVTTAFWQHFSKVLEVEMEKVTVAQLVESARRKRDTGSSMYYI